MIDQRKNNLLPKNFESKGNDVLSGNFGLGQFDPKNFFNLYYIILCQKK